MRLGAELWPTHKHKNKAAAINVVDLQVKHCYERRSQENKRQV
jgi:hypothetical protein